MLKDVEKFWSSNPCNSSLGISQDRLRWFQEIEADRYGNEPHILGITNFAEFQGKSVLEVGCGVGTDGRRFAQAGARYVGINLDNGSARYSREAMDIFHFHAPILQMDAERLGFTEVSFDHVYSFGVIHHSPNPEKIVSEIFRVLKPGGTLTIMLYNRRSINYYFEILFVRKLFRFLLVPASSPGILSRMLGLNEEKLRRHREIMVSETMTPERWVSINTDGPDCPLARVYSKAEGTDLLERNGFTDIKTCVRFFDKRHYGRLSKLFSPKAVRWLGNRWGWHLVLKAQKPIT